MSGHSKWATTKHKKAGIDAKRGKLFAKLIKNIEVAARTGGSDPAGNPTLYDAIQKAKKSSVPNDNIDRAVKRGSGAEAGGVDYQGITYEGYAAGGVAVLIECLTDNKNRSAMEVRTAMTRNGGSMADPGSVSYLFSRKGVVVVPKTDTVDEDAVLTAVLDAGAEEVRDLGDTLEVVSEPGDLVAVRTAMTRNGGSMADPGSVAYLFTRKGVVIVPKAGTSEDDVLAAVLEAGAEEVNDLDEAFEVVSEPGDLVGVRTALQAAGIDYESAEAQFVPSVTVPLEEDAARRVLRLVDALEDLDDVQDVYANFDIPERVLEAAAT